MEWLKTLLMVIQIIAAIGVIGLVLIQQGKGADMGAAFGSGASGSIFGATGSSNFLSRTTGILAAVFFCCNLNAQLYWCKTPGGRRCLSSACERFSS